MPATNSELSKARLYRAASYLEVDEDNTIMYEGNYHPYCQLTDDYDEVIDPADVVKKPSRLRRLLHTFF